MDSMATIRSKPKWANNEEMVKSGTSAIENVAGSSATSSPRCLVVTVENDALLKVDTASGSSRHTEVGVIHDTWDHHARRVFVFFIEANVVETIGRTDAKASPSVMTIFFLFFLRSRVWVAGMTDIDVGKMMAVELTRDFIAVVKAAITQKARLAGGGG